MMWLCAASFRASSYIEPAQLLARKDIPQAGFDPQSAVALARIVPVTSACALISRQSPKPRLGVGHRDVWMKASRVQRAEQTRALEIGRDDTSDLLSRLVFVAAGTQESRNGDGIGSTLPLVMSIRSSAGPARPHGAGAQEPPSSRRQTSRDFPVIRCPLG